MKKAQYRAKIDLLEKRVKWLAHYSECDQCQGFRHGTHPMRCDDGFTAHQELHDTEVLRYQKGMKAYRRRNAC